MEVLESLFSKALKLERPFEITKIEFLEEEGAIIVDGKILLDKYKLEKDFEGSIMVSENPELFPAKGTIGGKEKKK